METRFRTSQANNRDIINILLDSSSWSVLQVSAILAFSLTSFGRSTRRAGIEGEKARSVTYGTDLELGW